MKKDHYSSFTSLIWESVHTNRLRWKDELVWGVGVAPNGLGGIWFSSKHGAGFSSQFDAQAALELAYLEERKPPASDKVVETIAAHCDPIVAVSYRQLVSRTGLQDGPLDDALAKAADEGRIQIAYEGGRFLGYKLVPSFKPIPKEEIDEMPDPEKPLLVATTESLTIFQTMLKEIDGEMETLTGKRSAIQNIVAGMEQLQQINSRPGPEATPALTEKTFAGMELVQAAVKYLSIVGKSQTNKQILEGLTKGGYKTASANPVDTVRSVLKRASERPGTFIVQDDAGWALKEWN